MDTYGKTQLKIPYCRTHRHYKIGDYVTIPDGVYMGCNGVVVICGSRFIVDYPKITSAGWGGNVDYKLGKQIKQQKKAIKELAGLIKKDNNKLKITLNKTIADLMSGKGFEYDPSGSESIKYKEKKHD